MREAYKPCMECGRFILPELFAMHQRWHLRERRRSKARGFGRIPGPAPRNPPGHNMRQILDA
ncbi:hypothetical protein ES705_28823 [subsurface metagenome]